jgi:hypothetical protein
MTLPSVGETGIGGNWSFSPCCFFKSSNMLRMYFFMPEESHGRAQTPAAQDGIRLKLDEIEF